MCKKTFFCQYWKTTVCVFSSSSSSYCLLFNNRGNHIEFSFSLATTFLSTLLTLHVCVYRIVFCFTWLFPDLVLFSFIFHLYSNSCSFFVWFLFFLSIIKDSREIVLLSCRKEDLNILYTWKCKKKTANQKKKDREGVHILTRCFSFFVGVHIFPFAFE